MESAFMTMQAAKKNRKILVFIDQMQIGGAARVTSLMLEALADEYSVTICYDNVKYSTFYNIDNRVKIVPFHVKRRHIPLVSGIVKELGLAAKARNIIKRERPDVIISVTHLVFSQVYIGSIGLNIPIIAYDHTSFSRDLGFIQNFIRRSLYKRATKVILLTQKDREMMSSTLKNSCVVYNPLTFTPSYEAHKREKWVLCVGRLNSWHIKGLDRIISMWGEISPKAKGWQLVIAGGGSEHIRDMLLNMAKESGVKDSVTLLGQVDNLQNIYAKSSIFALPSRVEGFPMCLLEALSQGSPFVSFSMDGAVKEMATNGVSGFIIDDNKEDEFAVKLKELISNSKLREEMSPKAVKSVERFNLRNYSTNIKRVIESI